MKKKVIGVLSVVLILAFALPAFAAVSDSQKAEIGSLLKQIGELRKQIVDKYVAAGTITKEQGDQIKQNIDNITKLQEENSGNFVPGFGGCGLGRGAMGGCGGYGRGMMGGFGFGRNNGAVNQNTQWAPAPGQTI